MTHPCKSCKGRFTCTTFGHIWHCNDYDPDPEQAQKLKIASERERLLTEIKTEMDARKYISYAVMIDILNKIQEHP
jgi:hypothetical protein